MVRPEDLKYGIWMGSGYFSSTPIFDSTSTNPVPTTLSLSLLLAHTLLCILVGLCIGQHMFEVHSNGIQREDCLANPLTPATAWDCLTTNLYY